MKRTASNYNCNYKGLKKMYLTVRNGFILNEIDNFVAILLYITFKQEGHDGPGSLT
jgi:hypothetical protein